MPDEINSKDKTIFISGNLHIRHQFNRRFRQMTHVAPLGLEGKALSPGYRHIAPLGLNKPMPCLPFPVPFSIL